MGSTGREARHRTVCCGGPAKPQGQQLTNPFMFQQYAKASFTERPNVRVPSYKAKDQLDGWLCRLRSLAIGNCCCTSHTSTSLQSTWIIGPGDGD